MLSVLICSYNRPALLAKALRGLLVDALEVPDEVVLVNGGGMEVDQAVEPFLSTACAFRVIKTRNVSLAISQNIGLPECHGDLVALTDDDAIVAPDWSPAIRQVMQEHPEAGAVGGPVLTLYPENRIARLARYTTFPAPEAGGYVRTIAGVNICYRREVIEQVGKIDEALVAGEEVDYNWRVARAGWKVWWDPRIMVHHHDRRELVPYLRQQYTYGRAYWQTRRKHADLYCRYPRRLSTFKDLLKLAYFVPGLFVDPWITASRIRRLDDRWLFPPLLVLAGGAHRLGYLAESWRESRSRAPSTSRTRSHPLTHTP